MEGMGKYCLGWSHANDALVIRNIQVRDLTITRHFGAFNIRTGCKMEYGNDLYIQYCYMIIVSGFAINIYNLFAFKYGKVMVKLERENFIMYLGLYV